MALDVIPPTPHEVISRVADQTNLDPSTVQDLFAQGWTFTEEYTRPHRWTAPGFDTKFNTAEENSA